MKKIFLLIISTLIFGFVSTAQWVQVGEDIDGALAGDLSGFSVSLSSDGSTVAIGALLYGLAGHVRIYQNNNGIWTQLGQEIIGEGENDQSSFSVSLSNDGGIVAIGAWKNEGANGAISGHVRVYKNNGGAWVQVGEDIDGEAAADESGRSVSLNSDGTIVAISAPGNDGNGIASGHVRVYQNISDVWTQLGDDIDGEFALDQSGSSVSLSSDGFTLAVGAYPHVPGGHVRIFHFDGAWIQVGEDIDGESGNDAFGGSVSLSSDGSIVAIGAWMNGAANGHARIYQNVNGTWIQLGADIDGETSGDHFGWAVSLSSDGNTVAIGAPDHGSNPFDVGHVRIFQYNNSVWTQLGEDINGEAASDHSGKSVSISGDGSIVAIGAHNNDGSGNNAGHVRIYTMGVVGISEIYLPSISIHPNPTTGQIHIDLKTIEQNLTLNIYNSFGVLIHTEPLSNVSSFEYLLPETNGLYLVQLLGENGAIRTLKVVKE